MISSEDAQAQLETLRVLSDELRGLELEPAVSGILGLSIEEDGLWATLSIPAAEEDPIVGAIIGRTQITSGNIKDSRPLYIIPYDPAAADNQHPNEREYCTKQLFERSITYAAGIVGRASVPDEVCIVAEDVIRSATFKASDKWAATEDVNLLKNKVTSELHRVLARGEMKGKVELHNRTINVTIASEDDRRVFLDLLLKAPTGPIAQRVSRMQTEIET